MTVMLDTNYHVNIFLYFKTCYCITHQTTSTNYSLKRTVRDFYLK